MSGLSRCSAQGATPPPRRLVFLNRYFFPDHSATSQLLSDLAFALAAAGERVVVVAGRQIVDEPKRRLAPRETVRGVEVHRVWSTRFGRARLSGRLLDYATFYPGAALCLLRLVAAGDVVVAKSDPPLASVLAWPIARFKHALLVAWIQDLFPEIAEALGVPGMRGLLGRALRALRNASLRRAQAVVVPSAAMCARLVGEGLSEDRVWVIANWVDGAQIKPHAAAANPLRREWGLGERFVLGYSGNMGRAHEFETVLAAAHLLDDDPRFVFLFIGGGARKEWIEGQARERALRNVVLRPYQPTDGLPFSLTAPDAHLVTLRPEAEELVAPSKLAAATAAGRPVIFVGAPRGECARLIAASDAGVAIAPGDAAGLAATLRQWAAEPERVRRMGEASRALFEKSFAHEGALARWRALLALSPAAEAPA